MSHHRCCQAVALVYPRTKSGLRQACPHPQRAADLTFVLSGQRGWVKAVIKAASENGMKGIIKYSDLPLVSTDYAIPTSPPSLRRPLYSMGDKAVKILAWYDKSG